MSNNQYTEVIAALDALDAKYADQVAAATAAKVAAEAAQAQAEAARDAAVNAVFPTGYDLYVRQGAASGDGSSGSPFGTLVELKDEVISRSSGATVTCYIERGHYEDDKFDSGVGNLNQHVTLYFQEGCRLTNTPGVSGSGIQGYGTGRLTIYGNGLTIEDFDTGTGNGIAGGDTCTVRAFDCTTIRCLDGFTGHNSCHMEAYNCKFLASGKYGVVHVNSTTSRHVNCIIEGIGTGGTGIAKIENDLAAEFHRCTFRTADNTSAAIDFGGTGSTTTECSIGTPDCAVSINATGGGPASIINSYFNLSTFIQSNANYYIAGCFGKWNIRARNPGGGGAGIRVVGGAAEPPTGQTAFVFNNYDPGSHAPIHIEGVLVGDGFTWGVALGSAANLSYWTAAGSTFTNSTILATSGAEDSNSTGTTSGIVTTTPDGLRSLATDDMGEWSHMDVGGYGIEARDVRSVGADL
jgi:hypothetical protein